MSVCPSCRERLVPVKIEEGIFFRCRRCDGRAVGLSVLRRAIPPKYVRELWQKARGDEVKRGKQCPICRRAMVEVRVPVDQEDVPLDVCAGCQFVWFDPREFQQFPAQPRKEKESDRLPEKVREAIAMAELKRDELRHRGSDFGREAPEESWKWIPAIFGMPVEQDVKAVRCWPWVTWALAAVMVLTFAFTFADLAQVVEEFGLVPADALRRGGVTLITGFFLHAGLFHLIGNVYFLLVFGDNVEDHLGPWRYCLLVAAAAFFGDLLHIVADPRGVVPCVGASGGISGVIVFYALKFPRARLGFMFRWWLYFRWVYMPAWFALILWFLLQFFLAFQQLAGIGSVSALAHLGGAGIGVGAWLLWREDRGDREDRTEESFASLRRDPGRRP